LSLQFRSLPQTGSGISEPSHGGRYSSKESDHARPRRSSPSRSKDAARPRVRLGSSRDLCPFFNPEWFRGRYFKELRSRPANGICGATSHRNIKFLQLVKNTVISECCKKKLYVGTWQKWCKNGYEKGNGIRKRSQRRRGRRKAVASDTHSKRWRETRPFLDAPLRFFEDREPFQSQ
jgi:hypothetical protein